MRQQSKYTKGKNAEAKAKELLLKFGYLVEKKPNVQFQSKDFYRMFDLLAIKGSVVKFVQVKSNKSDFYTARIKISKWLKDYQLSINCEIWLYSLENDRFIKREKLNKLSEK